MSWALTIAGDAHELQADSLRITYHANDRTTCDFDIASIDSNQPPGYADLVVQDGASHYWRLDETSGLVAVDSIGGADGTISGGVTLGQPGAVAGGFRPVLYRPPLDAEVIIDRDGVRLFGGLINRPTERGLGGGARPHLITQCSAVDWAAYTDRRIIVDGGFPAGTTLKAALIDAASWLAPYGVTLDPAQVDGPALPEVLFPLNTVRDLLNAVTSLTASAGEPYVWAIDPFKVLRAFQPSTEPAPFDILTNAPPQVVGDITVEPSKEGYANRVYVVATPKTEDGRIETLPVGDGVTSTFALIYTPSVFRGYVTSDGIFETLNRVGDADAATWSYDVATNSVTRNPFTAEGFPAGPPGVGVISTIGFDGTFTGRGVAEDPSVYTDPWEKAITVDDVDNPDTLQDMADALLAESLLIPITVTYRTPTPGLFVGMSQTVTVPARNVDITGLITEIGLFDAGNRLWWDVTVLGGAQSNLNRGYRTTVRNWSGDLPSGGVSVGSGGPASVGPAPPNWSLQFNRNGAFGGNAAFLVYEPQASLHAGGGGTSITAASFESCQAFGLDCHIADA